MKRTRLGFTLLELFVVLTVVAILFSLALPLIITPAREASRKHACSDNIRRLGLAMLEYEQACKRLTSLNCTWGYGGYGSLKFWDVTPGYTGAGRWSGLIALLPYLNEGPLYSAFQDGTTGQWSNRQVLWGPYGSVAVSQQAKAERSQQDVVQHAWNTEYKPNRVQIGVFRCPSDPGKMRADSQWNVARINYAFCLGDSQIGINSGDPTIDQTRGAFQINKYFALADISDGLSSTAIFGEIATAETSAFSVEGPGETQKDAKVQGRAIYEIDHLDDFKGIDVGACRSSVQGGRYVGTKRNWGNIGSRAYDALPVYIGFNTINAPNAGSCTPISSAWGEGEGIYTASSYHPGGAHIVTFDNRVTFISNNINTSDNRVGVNAEDYYSPGRILTSDGLKETKNWALPSPFGVWGAIGTRSGWDYRMISIHHTPNPPSSKKLSQNSHPNTP